MSRIRRFRRATVVAVGIITGAAFSHPPAAQTLEETFNDPTPTFLDDFGSLVAIDGDNILIGAPGDDTQGCRYRPGAPVRHIDRQSPDLR